MAYNAIIGPEFHRTLCYFPAMPDRRFPPPWSVEERPACYMVNDANGFALAYVYYEEEPGRRTAAKLMTKDEARRIALGIAKLPDLVRKP